MNPVRRPARWLVPLVLVVVWLGLGGAFGSYAGKLGDVSTNDQAAFLPQNAESTKVIEQQKAFAERETLPAVLVWTADGGGEVSVAQQKSATRVLASLADAEGVESEPSPALRSQDGAALQGVVPLRPDLGEKLGEVLDELEKAAGDVSGTRVQIAGPAATQGDLGDAFAGIDGILLGVALAAVLLILLLVYRSVLLPFTIIISAVFALGIACAIVYVLADHDIVRVDGQVQGILSILVIGAATDYALLLTARFREELARSDDRFQAARKALRDSFGAITASAATVALGLLALLLSDLTNNRALGPVGAIGIVCAVLTTLTFLPAVLALMGKVAFWPAKPRSADAETGGHGIWRRVAHWVDTRPHAAVDGLRRPARRRRRVLPRAAVEGRAPGRAVRQRRAVRRRAGDPGQALPRRLRPAGRDHRRRGPAYRGHARRGLDAGGRRGADGDRVGSAGRQAAGRRGTGAYRRRPGRGTGQRLGEEHGAEAARPPAHRRQPALWWAATPRSSTTPSAPRSTTGP